jgi:transposase
MTIGKISISSAIAEIQQQIENDPEISPAIVKSINILILVIQLLTERLNVSSSNSSLPPSKDLKRKKRVSPGRKKSDKKPGGQIGHNGETLEKVKNPDEIIEIEIDRRTLPIRGDFKSAGFEARQVIDVVLNRVVTEYRAEILEDSSGTQYIATFPDNVSKAVQYGSVVKSLAVYFSQAQLVPYNRVQQIFEDQFDMKVSQGSIANFNKEAFEALSEFEEDLIQTLKKSEVLNADETGIKIGELNHWLHVLCTPKTTYFFPHEKRGKDAIDAMGILKNFKGVLCHDHWKPYLSYECEHALCNAHHLRELQWVIDFRKQKWAKSMQDLLTTINKETIKSGGKLSEIRQDYYIAEYRAVIKAAKRECPLTVPAIGHKGKVAQSKERNLLDRLEEYEHQTLLFMKHSNVPFTNNAAERDIRMAKVQQKISGCFRSMNGAKYFCRIRSYLLTSNKRGHSSFAQIVKIFEPKK